MKRIVIIGGGFAGLTVARNLEGNFDVTLIDYNDYFEFTPGILRTIVEPKHIEKIQKKYKDFLKNTKLIVGKASYVDEKKVIVNGKKLEFDYLVICSGSSYKVPIKEQEVVRASRAKHLVDAFENLKKSENVIIVGGGLAGVELTAEIVCKYPEKKITLIHSREELIQRNDKRARDYASHFLKRKKVNIVFGERLVKKNGKKVITDKNTELMTDSVFLCTGISPNSKFIKGKLKKSVNEKGYVNVNDYLQVNSFKNVFAPGDVNALKIEKTAQNAEHQAKIVVKNIMSLEKGKELKKYVEKKTPMVISLGKWNAIFEYRKLVFTGIAPAFLKWFVEKKEMLKL